VTLLMRFVKKAFALTDPYLETLMLRWFKNVLRHRLFRSLSIRSDLAGRLHMAELAVRFMKINEVGGAIWSSEYSEDRLSRIFITCFRDTRLRFPCMPLTAFKGSRSLEESIQRLPIRNLSVVSSAVPRRNS